MYIIAINSKTSGKFQEKTISGRHYLVTQMMAISGNTSMNSVFYPDDEVTASYQQLHMLPAPNSHPMIDGVNVPAKHPVATNTHNIGGFLRDPRKSGKRVFADLYLDTKIANTTDDGKELILRIKNGKHVGVSTGLSINSLEKADGKDSFGVPYTKIARGYTFDHVAVLLNERAAGSHAGTELITNAINPDLSEDELKTIFLADEISVTNDSQAEDTVMPYKKLIDTFIANSGGAFSTKDIQVLTAMDSATLIETIQATNAAKPVKKEDITVDVAKGVLVANGIDLSLLPELQTNAVEFRRWKEIQDKDAADLRAAIIANSAFTAEMLKDKPMSELTIIGNMLKTADRVPDGGGKSAAGTRQVDYSI